ncbi:hypothetical protein KORDIASMS9_03035 [Kordia sp. SMS9]|nr:hypothetical protein KORDIASMS9_03035 [Kordia sp. SMS9]
MVTVNESKLSFSYKKISKVALIMLKKQFSFVKFVG